MWKNWVNPITIPNPVSSYCVFAILKFEEIRQGFIWSILASQTRLHSLSKLLLLKGIHIPPYVQSRPFHSYETASVCNNESFLSYTCFIRTL